MEPNSPLNPAFRQAFDRLMVPATVRDLKRQGYEDVRLIQEDDLLAWAAEVLSRHGKDQSEQAQPGRLERSPGPERSDDGCELEVLRQQYVALLDDREKLERERANLEAEVRDLGSEVAINEQLRRERDELVKVRKALVSEVGSLRDHLERERANLEAAERDLQNEVVVRERLRRERDDLEKARKAMDIEVGSLRDRLDHEHRLRCEAEERLEALEAAAVEPSAELNGGGGETTNTGLLFAVERERQAFKEHIAKVRAESELRLQELRRLSGLLKDVESGGVDIHSSLSATIERERGKFENLLGEFHSSAKR